MQQPTSCESERPWRWSQEYLKIRTLLILGQTTEMSTPRILSLDGGGVSGLSALLVLQEIMKKIGQQTQRTNREDTPRPCEYFDLICGTSTGGLIAIMLGLFENGISQDRGL